MKYKIQLKEKLERILNVDNDNFFKTVTCMPVSFFKCLYLVLYLLINFFFMIMSLVNICAPVKFRKFGGVATEMVNISDVHFLP